MSLSLLSTGSWCVVRAYTWLALSLSLLSTGSWCVVSADTWLALCLSLSSPPVAGVWWAHTLDWLYDSLSSPPVAGVWWEHPLDWLNDSLSSPPVAGVWWAHWRRCAAAAVASSKWMLHTSGGWGETPPPHMIVKRLGVKQYTIKKRYIDASFIHSFICFILSLLKPCNNFVSKSLK